MVSERLVVLSGCSGGGKSTLLDALAARGHAVVPEAGRRLLREEQARGGNALPWVDPTAFLHRILAMALADHAQAASLPGPVFFDRGIIDALSGLEHRTGESFLRPLGAEHRYHPRVFLAPPWREIYVQDNERRHDFAKAEPEYHRLRRDYPALGYQVVDLPKLPVAARAAFVLDHLKIV